MELYHFKQGDIIPLEEEELEVLITILTQQSISPSSVDLDNRILILPQGIVGYIDLPTRKLVINPKNENIKLSHVIRILNFLYVNEDSDLDNPIYDIDNSADFNVAIQFIGELKKTLMIGLPVAYLQTQSDLKYMRGSLNPIKTLVNLSLHKQDIFDCSYDDLTKDIHINRILKAALKKTQLLLRDESISYLDKYFSQVSDIFDFDVDIQINRNNEYCKKSLSLAKMILNDMSIIDQGDKSYGSGFLLNFDRLFEKFIKAILYRYSEDNHFSYWDYSKSYGFYYHNNIEIEKEFLPDILYRYKENELAGSAESVIDTKNKFGTPFSNSDVYQMFFYTKMMSSNKAILCYPSTNELKTTFLKFSDEDFHLKYIYAVYLNLSGNSASEFKYNIQSFVSNLMNLFT